MFALLAPAAHAAFVNNVEHFDGFTKDLSTWAEYDGGGTTSQGGRLFVNSLNGVTEYRARFATVGVGGFVQSTARFSAIGPDGGSFFLVLNTPPYPLPFYLCDRSASLRCDNRLCFAFQDQGNGQGTSSSGDGQALEPLLALAPNRDYVLRLDYLSATSVRYQIFDAAMNPLASQTRVLDNLPDRFFITIGADEANASFDDVTIGGNASAPEPSAVFVIGGVCQMLSWRRCRTCARRARLF